MMAGLPPIWKFVPMALSPLPPPPRPPAGAAPAPGSDRAARWRQVRRRVGMGALAAVILFLVVFFLLPVWISNEQGRAYVLQRFNRRLAAAAGADGGPGRPTARVLVDEWSVGWFRPTELKNLRAVMPDGTPVLACPRVESGLTLWDMLWGNYDLRNTRADGLQLTVVKYPDGRTSVDALVAGVADLVRTARGGLQINGGEVTLISVRAGQTVRYTDVAATVTIASPEAPFHLQVAAASAADMAAGAADAADRRPVRDRPFLAGLRD